MKPLFERYQDWKSLRNKKACIQLLYENFFGLREELTFHTRARNLGSPGIPDLEEDLLSYFNETCQQIDRLEDRGILSELDIQIATKLNQAVRMAFEARQNAERYAAVRLGREPPTKAAFAELHRPPGGWGEFVDVHWERLLEMRKRIGK